MVDNARYTLDMQQQPGRPKRHALCLSLTEPHAARLSELAWWSGLSRAELIRRWIDAEHATELTARRTPHEQPRVAS